MRRAQVGQTVSSSEAVVEAWIANRAAEGPAVLAPSVQSLLRRGASPRTGRRVDHVSAVEGGAA